MQFRAYAKSVKADVAKKEFTISFTVALDEQSLATAQELAGYTSLEAGPVDLKITPYQRSFKANHETGEVTT